MRPEHKEPPAISLSGRIRQRRKELGLTQRELAGRLGVTVETIRNWERGRTRPGLRQTPVVADFLNRFPLFRVGRRLDFQILLQLARHRLGISQAELADQIGVTKETVWEWENGHHQPSAKYRKHMDQLVSSALAHGRIL